MDQPGNHLLAGAGFAGDQNRRLRRRDLNRGLDQARHRLGAADQVLPVESVGETLLEESILLLETAVLHRPLYRPPELVEIERLGQVVVGAFLERLHGRLHGGVGGHDHDGDSRIERLDFGQRREARNLDHPDIHQDQVERLSLRRQDGCSAVVRLLDRVSPTRKEFSQHRSVRKVVIRNQDRIFFLHGFVAPKCLLFIQAAERLPSFLCPVHFPDGPRRRVPPRSSGRSPVRVPFRMGGS